MARILITGANGFVGARIAEAARSAGHDVLSIAGPHSPAETLRVDVSEKTSVAALRTYGDMDAVVHAAGIAHRTRGVSAQELHKVNALGPQYTAELAAVCGTKRFVLISSVLVYGRSGRVPGKFVSESDACSPDHPYAESKLDGERLAAQACAAAGIAFTALRPAPIIGERGKGNFDRLMRAIASGRFIRIGRGSNRRTLVYVGDVADAAVKCAVESLHGTFNLGAPPITMHEIVDEISIAFGRRPPKTYVSTEVGQAAANVLQALPLTRERGSTLSNWLAEDIYSTDAATAAGIGAKTPIREAIQLAVDEFRDQ